MSGPEANGFPDSRVVISNVYRDDNKGGAAITMATVAAALEITSEPNVVLVSIKREINARTTAYRHTLARYPRVQVMKPLVTPSRGPVSGLRSALSAIAILAFPNIFTSEGTKEIARSDVVIGKGGQMLWRDRFGFRRSLGLWLALFPLALARRMHKITVLYSVTIGPFRRWDPGRLLARTLLRKLDLVFVRDAVSFREATSLGVSPTALHLMPDCVFSIPPPSTAAVTRIRDTTLLGEAHTGVLVIPSSLRNQRSEIFAIVKGAWIRVLEAGLVERVVLVLQDMSDLTESHAFVDYVEDKRFSLIETDFPPEDLLAVYSEARVIVSGRIHGVVLSFIAGSPAIALEPPNSGKARNILSHVDLADQVMDIADLDEVSLGDAILQIIRKETELRIAISKRVAEARSQVLSSEEELKRRIFDLIATDGS